MNLWKYRLPQVKGQVLLLFFLTVAFLINSMALFYRRHYPYVILFNPATNLAKLVQANRDDSVLRDLFLGGLRNATAITTGSYPYEIPATGQVKVKKRILRQIFAEEALPYVLETRGRIGVHQPFGTVELLFHSSGFNDAKIIEGNGGIYLEAFFNQVLPFENHTKRIRTFHVRSFGHLAPATMDNPYGLKFGQISIKEIQPKSTRD